MNEHSYINTLSNNKGVIMKQVDENQTKVDAILVAFVLCGYLYSGYYAMLFLLTYDFFVRLYLSPVLSPFYALSRLCVKVLRLKRKDVDAEAKFFADNIALTVLIFILASEFGQEHIVSVILILSLVFWKIVEATKNICVGCKLFQLLRRHNIEIVSL
jgi:hypothetical protein